MIQPLGTPVDDVEAVVAVDSVVAPATHGHPVSVAVSPEVLPPRPAGMEGEADVAEPASAVATEVDAPSELPLIVPPTASMLSQLPLVSPYLYCVPVE